MVTQINPKNNILKLSIQVSLNGLSFCILDTETKEIRFFKELEFKQQLDPEKVLSRIRELYQQEEALQQDIGELKLIFSNALYSLVPKEYFDPGLASDYLKFNIRILQTDFITHDEIPSAGAVCVYIPYANISNFFFERYGEFEYTHSIVILIKTLLERESSSSPTAYLLNRTGSYDLVVLENKKLIFCNSFSYETPEDFLYYLLFTAEQLNLDPNTLNLQLLGGVPEDSDLMKMAYRYIRHINMTEGLQGYHFAKGEEKKRAWDQFVLLNSF